MGILKATAWILLFTVLLVSFTVGIVAGEQDADDGISDNQSIIHPLSFALGGTGEGSAGGSDPLLSQVDENDSADSFPDGIMQLRGTDATIPTPPPAPDSEDGSPIPEISPTPTPAAPCSEIPASPEVTATEIPSPSPQGIGEPCSECGRNRNEKERGPPAGSPALQQKRQKELEDVQAAIKAKDKKWQAGKTSVSELSDEEFENLLGIIPKSPVTSPEGEETLNQPASAGGESTGSPAGYPAFLDWRNNGGDYTTPIRNQGNCGSCWAFATLGTFESRMEIAYGNPNLNPDFAEQDLVSCAGCGGCSGAYMDCPLNWVLNRGAMNESCYPYVARDTSCNPGCSRTYRISGWNRITPLFSENAIKEALTRGPVIGTMAVYQDFTYYAGGVYEYSWGSLRGYHAIVIVGWGQDERGTYWICKNSWGTGWGEAGWFRIRSGNCGINNELYELTVAPPPPPPAPHADFLATPAQGIRPLSVQFTDLSTNSPTAWQWNFGDGSANATVQNPVHTYSSAGNYTVTLTATNAFGSSTIRKTNYITVTPPPPFLAGGWSYRKLHTISGSSSGDLTDYQVRFKLWNTTGTDSGENVYLGANVTPDFRDIRFTTTDNTPHSYWIEETGPTYAIFWVKIPAIPTTGSQVYLYYGNPSASSLSDGDATFLFFDDFNDNSLNPSKWTVVSGGGSATVLEQNGQLQIRSDGSNRAYARTATTFSAPYVLEFSARKGENVEIAVHWDGAIQGTYDGINNGYRALFCGWDSPTKFYLDKYSSGSSSTLKTYTSSLTQTGILIR